PMSQTVAGRRAAAMLAALALTLAGSPVRAWTSGAGGAANRAQTPPPAGNQNAPPQMPPDDSGQLDPGAPLESWPDLGVEWPDLDQPDELPEMAPVAEPPTPDGAGPVEGAPIATPGAAPVVAQPPVDEATQGNADAAALRRYSWHITGLDALEGGEEILDQFRDLSTLQEYQGDPANAAQVDRRANADEIGRATRRERL